MSTWETTATRIIIILLKYFIGTRLDLKSYKIIIVKSEEIDIL
jgi:hypothetical protein